MTFSQVPLDFFKFSNVRLVKFLGEIQDKKHTPIPTFPTQTLAGDPNARFAPSIGV